MIPGTLEHDTRDHQCHTISRAIHFLFEKAFRVGILPGVPGWMNDFFKIPEKIKITFPHPEYLGQRHPDEP